MDPCLILDAGSWNLRIGSSHDLSPQIIPSPLRNQSSRLSTSHEKYFSDVIQSSGTLNDRAVLVSEPLQFSNAARETRAQLLFESANVSAALFFPSIFLCSIGAGLASTWVLECGHSMCTLALIYDGRPQRRTAVSTAAAGAAMTALLSSTHRVSAEVKDSVLHAPSALCGEANRGVVCAATTSARLPDGTTIDFPRSVIHDVGAVPFTGGSEHIGIGTMCAIALGRCAPSMRQDVPTTIVAGGVSMMPGFAAAVSEAAVLSPLAVGPPPAEVPLSERAVLYRDPMWAGLQVSSPEERGSLAWTGGAVLAHLPTMRHLWVPRATYDEQGPRALCYARLA